MSKLFILFSLLFLSCFTAGAQVQLSDGVAKKVITELLQKDSLSSEVTYLDSVLQLTRQIDSTKDRTINTYKDKEVNYQGQIKNQESIINNDQKAINDCQKENKKLHRKIFWVKIEAVVIAGAVATIVLLVK